MWLHPRVCYTPALCGCTHTHTHLYIDLCLASVCVCVLQVSSMCSSHQSIKSPTTPTGLTKQTLPTMTRWGFYLHRSTAWRCWQHCGSVGSTVAWTLGHPHPPTPGVFRAANNCLLTVILMSPIPGVSLLWVACCAVWRLHSHLTGCHSVCVCVCGERSSQQLGCVCVCVWR